jgi:protoheme IX farnesyltransferase
VNRRRQEKSALGAARVAGAQNPQQVLWRQEAVQKKRLSLIPRKPEPIRTLPIRYRLLIGEHSQGRLIAKRKMAERLMTDITAVDQNSGPAGVAFSEASVGDYIALLKPRVMSLVVFTALVGLMVTPGHLHPVLGFAALLCIATGAGAAGALNMWYDADVDAVMSRTSRRPIPAGRVLPREALAFGLTLAIASIAVLGLVANWLAASLLAFTIFFYVAIYTMWLKRTTPQNIVVGGAAGAFPPMIGWAAATGTVDLESVLLFLIIFLWTPPHFWALSLWRAQEYARAGIPMLPSLPAMRRRGGRSCCIRWCSRQLALRRGCSATRACFMA